MGYSRKWMVCLLVLELASVAGTMWLIDREVKRDGASIGEGFQTYEFISHYRGYPLPWRHTTQRRVTSGYSFFFEGKRGTVISDERSIDGENIVLPVVFILLAITVPWVVLTGFSKRPPARFTRYIRVLCLASATTFTFCIGDILTGHSSLGGGYYETELGKTFLMNEYVHQVVVWARESRPGKYADAHGLNYNQLSDQISRRQSIQTVWVFCVTIAICMPIYRPWRRFDLSPTPADPNTSPPLPAAPPSIPESAPAPIQPLTAPRPGG